jgi:hypothetical protein
MNCCTNSFFSVRLKTRDFFRVSFILGNYRRAIELGMIRRREDFGIIHVGDYQDSYESGPDHETTKIIPLPPEGKR